MFADAFPWVVEVFPRVADVLLWLADVLPWLAGALLWLADVFPCPAVLLECDGADWWGADW